MSDTPNIKRLLERSIKLSQKLNDHKEIFACFAFVYNGNRLLSIGRNNTKKTDAKVSRFGVKFKIPKFINWPFRHAEIDAISRLWGRYYLSDKDTLIVVRLSKKNQPVLAKPCVNCQTVLNALNITKVYWTGE